MGFISELYFDKSACMKKLILLTLTGSLFFINVQAQKLDHVLGDVIVQMKPGSDVRQLERSLQTFQGKSTRLKIQRELSAPLRIWLLSFDFTTINETALLHELRRQPGVQEAQLNHLISMRETTPDDPAFGQQWQWVNTGQNNGTPDADVDADLAWDITTGGATADGREIVVCVVEGGNLNHPDLKGNLWVNQAEIPGNGIDDDGNGYIDDYKGWNITTDSDNVNSESHGTTVGGMIGAKGNNGLLVTGINWDVKLMYVDFQGVNEANVIEAYTYPLVMRRRYNQSGGTQGAFVVATNSSWGIDGGNPADSPLWCAFYDSLGVEGVLSCGATANNNVNVDVVGDLPTACSSEYMIAVTASNRNDVRTFSGYGVTHIDVAAPGESIVSINLNGGPNTTSGTSFASPLTAGIIALLYSAPCSIIGDQALVDPAGTALLIRDALYAGVDKKPNLTNEVKTGGRVNAFNSLQILLQSCGPCPKPYSIALTNVIDTSAFLTWKSTDSTLQTILRWRMAGDTIWNSQENAVSPFAFTGLLACTEYEFQLEDACADTTSGYTNPFIFKTDGCCEPPGGLKVNFVISTGAVAFWNSVYAANSYNLLLTSSQGSQLFEGLTDTLFTLSNLEPCTDYAVQVQTVCDTGLTDFTPLVNFSTFGCGACTDFTYCNSGGSNASQEWIAFVSLGTLENASGTNGGYGDFTGVITELETYQAYPISLAPGFSGNSFSEWWAVWIDYNQDGDFNDAGEKAFDPGSVSNAIVNGTIVVPGSALPGLTRMRVVMRFNAQPVPCNSYNFGETEDYCVNIVPGTPPDCYPPDGLAVAEVGYTAAKLQWNSVGDALTYDIRYRRTGTTTWAGNTLTDTFRTLINLLVCTEYEFQVRAACLGLMSDWSPSFVFTTACYPPCNDVPTGLDTALVGMNSAIVRWNATANALKYKVAFKKVTDPNFSLVLVTDTSHVLEGLLECTEYQFSVRSVCLGDLEGVLSELFNFKTDCLSSADDVKLDLQQVYVFPNPFNAEINVSFSMLQSQEVTLDLFDARGQCLYSFTGAFLSGENRFTLGPDQTGELPSGFYFVKMTAGNGYVVRKVVKE